jgi:TetR/AcrR family transcriptional regulator, regulator of cefoperazone and chloramphenicol sensitivity
LSYCCSNDGVEQKDVVEMADDTHAPGAAPLRRQELCAAAIEVIVESGVAGLRTREVARRAGVTHATLHHYFPRKADLVEAAFDQLLKAGWRCREAMPQADGNSTALQRLDQVLTTVYGQVRRNPTWLAVLEFRDSGAGGDLLRLRADWHAYLTGLIEEAVGAGEIGRQVVPGELADLLITIAYGIAVESSNGLGPAEAGQELYGIGLLRMLAMPG